MPRSYDEIVRLSESMAESLESDDTEPTTSPEEAALRAAALRRSLAETELGNAVATARRGGVPWQRIGEAVGTSGEAARQKYKHLVDEGQNSSTARRSPAKSAAQAAKGTSSARSAHKGRFQNDAAKIAKHPTASARQRTKGKV